MRRGHAPVPPVGRRRSAVHFDARTYSLRGDRISLFTMRGRMRIAFRIGAFQRAYLERGAVREADLVHHRKHWYLHVSMQIPDHRGPGGIGVLGVDVGENVIAALSSGALYKGGGLKAARSRYLAFRRRLQSNGSQSARQLLARISGRESRHARHVNHEISARIVDDAKARGFGTIAMEDLKHIRQRIRAGKRVRARLHRWSWRQLQQFIQYKAEGAGLAVIYIDPPYTSQTCASCGRLGTRRQSRFACKECGIFAHSDRNAARNIAKIAASALAATGAVVHPNVAG